MYSNKFYNKYKKNVYSQNGEDGIIEELLKRLNINKGWVCEFGAWDGIHLSNTFKLVKENFNAVFIEGDKNKYNDLLQTVKKYPNITPIKAFVDYNDNENSLDNLLKKTDIPIDFDVLSIDIDSYDYQVWKSLKIYKPKIVIIEINSSVKVNNQNWIHTPGKYEGTGFKPTYDLGVNKGYKFILHTGNMFFIRSDLFDKLNISYDNPLENFRTRWGGGVFNAPKMSFLHTLGVKYKTDKYDQNHSFKNTSYCDIYDKYFTNIRHKVKKFVEIGIKDGCSLRMWKEYFPNATIYGIDIDPRCKQIEEDRIVCLIGDQNCETFLNEAKNIIGEYDILLDDGSHITKHQITSFNILYENCKENGFYIIEDLLNSYEEFLNHHNLRKIWPGMKYNKENDELKNYRKDFNEFIEDKVKQLDFQRPKKMFAIHHYNMIVIFENGFN